MIGGAGRKVAQLAESCGIRRVALVAWRDLDDPEAGGSELHAHEIARRWAGAGLEVVLRTSAVAGGSGEVSREGYKAVRRSGRYQVFATAPSDAVRGRLGPLDGLVEVWNGMPFFSPLWAPRGCARAVFLHHVHAEMWDMVLPPRLAALGRTIESRLAPPIYRFSDVVTLSRSSRDEIVRLLRLRPARVHVVPPGIDPCFTPGGRESPCPLVIAVGRLVPVKRFDRLIRAVARVHSTRPEIECVIVGEGSERNALERLRRDLGADGYVHLPGHLDRDRLVELYQRAWVLAAPSSREGWGMSITEAAACGTPAVASRIAGHDEAIAEGKSGLLASDEEDFATLLSTVIEDDSLRRRLSKGALKRTEALSWDIAAEETFAVLARRRTRSAATDN